MSRPLCWKCGTAKAVRPGKLCNKCFAEGVKTVEPPQDIYLEVINIKGGTQPRAAIDQETVKEYAELYKTGHVLPPVVVFFDGAEYWLADGFHRFHARKKAGLDKLPCDVRQGTQRDAILHSVGANASHEIGRAHV